MLVEVNLDALHVSFEVVFSVWMRSGHHLREINHSHFFIVIYHQVELIVISVNKSMLRQLNNQINQILVHLLWMWDDCHLSHRVSLNKRHANSVSIRVNWHRRREPSFVESYHKSVFL